MSKALNHFAVRVVLKNVVIKMKTLNELMWANWSAHKLMFAALLVLHGMRDWLTGNDCIL